jgi:hypothetical protein
MVHYTTQCLWQHNGTVLLYSSASYAHASHVCLRVHMVRSAVPSSGVVIPVPQGVQVGSDPNVSFHWPRGHGAIIAIMMMVGCGMYSPGGTTAATCRQQTSSRTGLSQPIRESYHTIPDNLSVPAIGQVLGKHHSLCWCSLWSSVALHVHPLCQKLHASITASMCLTVCWQNSQHWLMCVRPVRPLVVVSSGQGQQERWRCRPGV